GARHRMTAGASAAMVTGGIALLERAMGYTLGRLPLVTPAALASPTPCREWDLRALLAHLDDSLLALYEAVAAGSVGLDPAGPAGAAEPRGGHDPVATGRARVDQTMGDWAHTDEAGAGEASEIGDRLPTPRHLTPPRAV